jgi:hypothetical protein
VAASDVLGVWHLVTVEDHQPDGSIIYPYGEKALGHLIYHPDGYMSASVMASQRDLLTRQARPWELTPDEAALVLKTMGSMYSGRWELRGDSTVIHHVDAAVVPNMIGRDEARTFELKGDMLYVWTLRPPQKTCAVWRRADKLT